MVTNLIYHTATVFGMQLYVLRHGEAGKRLPSGSKDAERPLTVTGKEEVGQVAEALLILGLKLDVIASSPLERALQTAEIVAKTFKAKKKIELWDELKPEASRLELYKKLSTLKRESSIMIVGHEPFLSTMMSDLVFDGSAEGRIILKKSGLAKLSINSFQPKAQGELRWLLTPRHLKKMQ
jgi:phosphohistidine phosphatase